MGEYPHKIGYMLAVIITIPVIALTFAFNGLAASGPNAVFESNTGDISDKYFLEITPAGWAFSIWGIIYAWQMLWIVYGLSTLCRKGINGYLYYSPATIPPALYIVYWVNLICNIGWLLLWDREYMPWALALIASLVVTLGICLFLSYRAVLMYRTQLLAKGLCKEIWFNRWFVQNGLAIYATWVSIATLINLGIVLAYWADMDQSDASTVCLSVLAFDIVLWFSLDVFVFDKWGTRYTFTPYFVIVWALGAIIDKNYESGARNSIFCVVLIVVGFVALIAKFVIMIVRHQKNKTSEIKSTLEENETAGMSNMNKC